LTSERARTEKFVAGIMIHTGDPAYELVRKGFDIAIKKLGVYGVSVRIIPPDVELPDEFKVKEVSKEELEALKAKIMGGGGSEDGGDKKDEQGGETKET